MSQPKSASVQEVCRIYRQLRSRNLNKVDKYKILPVSMPQYFVPTCNSVI
jgi:hypothetical protein